MRLKRLPARATVIAGVVLALAGLSATPAAAEGRPDTACGAGFNEGPLTLEQRLELPLVQAGLAAGVYTVESITEATIRGDRNQNGLLCIQVIEVRTERAAPPSGWPYLANVVDDNAAARP
jgi:hypothetical protein